MASVRPTQIFDYDPCWLNEFEREAAVLAEALAPWLVGGRAGIQHVGSTSVPGLAAKPIIDMMAAVHDLEGAKGAIAVLESLSYTLTPHRPATLHFDKQGDPLVWDHTHALHLYPPGHPLERERLTFRDALRVDAELRARYERLKRELAREHPGDREAYGRGKTEFCLVVMRAAGVEPENWRVRVAKE